MVFTSRGVSYVCLGTDNIRLVVEEGAVPGRDRLDECEVHRQHEDLKGSPHARWAELIGSYSFTISHARVIVEDCVSRCPSHLPEPTQEELDMEKDWEADPPPHLDLDKLANESAQLPARPEQICQTQGDSIQMNMMFDNGKVRIGWERPDEEDGLQQDWTEQLESTITELYQDTEEEPGIWVHDWGWTQTANQPTYVPQRSHQ